MQDENRSDAKVYVLNTPVLTGYGDWRLEGPIAVERAAELLSGEGVGGLRRWAMLGLRSFLASC